MLDAAVDYVQRGIAVFPCLTRDTGDKKAKAPLTINGFKDASANIEQIKAWWNKFPDAAIAMPTGKDMGIVVVDIDPRHGGNYNLDELVAQYGKLPDTLICMTGGGGVHYYFRHPGGTVKNSSGKIAPGIDVKADGGYVILPPSGHQSGNNYFWDGTEDFDYFAVSDMPQWLINLIESPEPQHQPSADGNTIPEGYRNQSLASLAGSMRRVGMTESEVLAAISVTNQLRCQPPLDEDEVTKIAKSICRYEPDEVSAAVAENHYDQMYDTEKTTPSIIDPGPIPDELLNVPGLVNEVMDFNLETAIRPQPVLALAGALQLQAVLAGRKVRDLLGNRTNLYVIGVGQAGSGKDKARKVNRDILEMAGMSDYEGTDDLASDAGLISAVEAHPAILFQLDEFGRFLRTIGDPKKAPHLYNVISGFMKFYSLADSVYKGKAYADRSKNKTIYYPCVGLYATTVPASLYQGITAESLTDGFYSRLLVFSTEDMPKRQRKKQGTIPERIIKQCKWWHQFHPSGNLQNEYPDPVELQTTPQALEIFNDLAERVDEQLTAGDIYSSLWARTEEKACRLVIIYACSENPENPKITQNAASWACAITEHITKHLMFIAEQWVSDGHFDEKQKKVIRIIEKEGGKITKTALGEKTRSFSKKDRQEIIENLLETRTIRQEVLSTQTNKATYYVLNK